MRKRSIIILASLLIINTLYSQNNDNIQEIYNYGLFSQDFYEQIIGSQENDYFITSFDKNEGDFSVILSKNKNISVQNVIEVKGSDLNNETLKGLNDQGGYVSHMATFMGNWYIVMSGVQTGIGQKEISSQEFPENEVKEAWKDNYYITSLDFDLPNENWKIILSKGVKINKQKWFVSSEFPADKIDKELKDGYYISSLKYIREKYGSDKNTWVMVLSKKVNSPKQIWKKIDKSSLNKEINICWNDGYFVTQIVNINDFYYLIMSSELIEF